jgi:myo-inositol 2-dehydrogenase/D-chiro-inositol 1-dehydrogenase
MSRVRVGLIGAGRIGTLHAEHLAYRIPGAELVAVADVAIEAARACAARYGVPLISGDYHDLLQSEEIDAVVICSSTDTHAQIIGEAAEAGKQVFCEKPIDFDLQRIDRALQAVGHAGVKLQIGFNRRPCHRRGGRRRHRRGHAPLCERRNRHHRQQPPGCVRL